MLINKFKSKNNSNTHSVFLWFFTFFSIMIIIFFLIIIPMINYSKKVFTNLEIEKSTQQLNTGINELENTINSLLSVSEILSENTTYIALRYDKPNFKSVDISTRNQMQQQFYGLMFPLTLVKDSALQFDTQGAILSHQLFFDKTINYYPNFFSVDNFSAEEWLQLLDENHSGFMPAHQITTNTDSYEGLIYSAPWTKHSYIYACMDITDIKKTLVEESEFEDTFITITDSNNIVLYSDLPYSAKIGHTITKYSNVCSLNIQIHLTENLLLQKTKPLYAFLTAYLAAVLIILIITIYIASRLSSAPLVGIIRRLEHMSNTLLTPKSKESTDTNSSMLTHGFDYITNNILHAQMDILHYKEALDAQTFALRIRYMERAVSGKLNTIKDRETFHTYFPNFPESYRLIQLRLLTNKEIRNPAYTNETLLLHSYLDTNLPEVFHLQLNDVEFLLVLPAADYEACCKPLNLLIENVNRTEPAYNLKCVASGTYQSLEELPTAYSQLQTLFEYHFSESAVRVCTANDTIQVSENALHVEDLFTFYTSVTYGNLQLALQSLEKYHHELSNGNRHIYEMFRTVLVCLQLENNQEAPLTITIPKYRPDTDLYSVMANTVSMLCASMPSETELLVHDIVKYIDEHYTDYSLCLTTLINVFNRSSSSIRKLFKDNIGVTVADYIEKKRMTLANELLTTSDMTVENIALRCGFSNANSFYRAYKRIYGHSPTAMKNRN